jgi:hypothetical protein
MRQEETPDASINNPLSKSAKLNSSAVNPITPNFVLEFQSLHAQKMLIEATFCGANHHNHHLAQTS